MSEEDLEGSTILEKLAEVGLVEAFFEAVDSDNFARAKSLMLKAHIEPSEIQKVMKMLVDE
jgi:hypothetical protein